MPLQRLAGRPETADPTTAAAWSRTTRLDGVMAEGEGSSEVLIGLLDGPVDASHPGFGDGFRLRSEAAGSLATRHGTAVAGVLAARRDSGAPGVCPGCRVLVRPVFTSASNGEGPVSTGPSEVAEGVYGCVAAGARLINLSAGFDGAGRPSRVLSSALDHAAGRGVLVVVAAGNDGRVGGSPLVSHPAVVPVTSCDAEGLPLPDGNLGLSVARRGVRAPGMPVRSLAPGGGFADLGGTSLSAALVTGALALAWSLAPGAPVAVPRRALLGDRSARRCVVPPLLDAARLAREMSAPVMEVRP
ncbi:S8 family serine peptidase [Streptomyces sp. NPDC046887]|uniref:S8 family serine peptidase n=1 Tax=Streptomyces sp. NPDC046887 TaxID=3155472 RepID=UPI0033D4557C